MQFLVLGRKMDTSETVWNWIYSVFVIIQVWPIWLKELIPIWIFFRDLLLNQEKKTYPRLNSQLPHKTRILDILIWPTNSCRFLFVYVNLGGLFWFDLVVILFVFLIFLHGIVWGFLSHLIFTININAISTNQYIYPYFRAYEDYFK